MTNEIFVCNILNFTNTAVFIIVNYSNSFEIPATCVQVLPCRYVQPEKKQQKTFSHTSMTFSTVC